MADMGCSEIEKSLLCLADELIDMILSYPLIGHKDLSRCAQVCRRLNAIAMGNELWKKKGLKRWAFWRTVPRDDWWSMYRDRILMERKVMNMLQMIAIKYYTKPEVHRAELGRFAQLAEENSLLSVHVDNSLTELLQGDHCKTNLTFRYYALKVSYHLKVHRLKKEWANLLSLPEDQQKLEEGAFLISKWILSSEEDNDDRARAHLDEIAQMVLNSLCDMNQMNTTGCSVDDMFTRGDDGFITDPAVCLRILNSMKSVMFQKLKFKGNTTEYYRSCNSMLHQVLKYHTGNPITLSVVFMAVAWRLGVKLEPVNFPNHFLLRWKASQDPEADNATSFKYIDCFNGGRFLSEEQCVEMLLSPMYGQISESLFVKAAPKQVFIRMAANIINSFRTAGQEDKGCIHGLYQQNKTNGINCLLCSEPGTPQFLSISPRLRGLRSALDLLLFFNPDDENMRFLQARIQIHLGVDLEEAIDSIETLLSSNFSIQGGHSRGILESLLERANQKHATRDLEDEIVQPKLRSDPRHAQVAFKVGMVMRHKLYNYGCVIYGWDPVCKMDEHWIQQMGVDRSPNGRNQPFYNVLGDDCSTRYAAHGNLREDPNQPFNPHPEIGRHFKAFTGTSYIPNECLQRRYPEDIPDGVL